MTLEEPAQRSFTDPETEFDLVRSDSPVWEDGFELGEPTGEIVCCACGAMHDNIDEIPHQPACPQRWVKSRFWAECFAGDGPD